MMRFNQVVCAGLISAFSFFADQASAQTYADTPQTRMRPIGTYSRPSGGVDRAVNRQPVQATRTDYRVNSGNQPTIQLQQFEVPGTPPTAPPTTSPVPITGGPSTPGAPVVTNPLPGGLPAGSVGSAPVVITPAPTVSSSSDLMPLGQPQLNSQFATLGNCACISGPSTYTAATGIGGCGGCAPVSYQSVIPNQPGVIAQPGIIPQAGVPGFAAPTAGTGTGTPGALLSFGQQLNPVVVGQGILGQPVAFVPGQTFRNWLRYIFP